MRQIECVVVCHGFCRYISRGNDGYILDDSIKPTGGCPICAELVTWPPQILYPELSRPTDLRPATANFNSQIRRTHRQNKAQFQRSQLPLECVNLTLRLASSQYFHPLRTSPQLYDFISTGRFFSLA